MGFKYGQWTCSTGVSGVLGASSTIESSGRACFPQPLPATPPASATPVCQEPSYDLGWERSLALPIPIASPHCHPLFHTQTGSTIRPGHDARHWRIGDSLESPALKELIALRERQRYTEPAMIFYSKFSSWVPDKMPWKFGDKRGWERGQCLWAQREEWDLWLERRHFRL